jgi:hypothetical protein
MDLSMKMRIMTWETRGPRQLRTDPDTECSQKTKIPLINPGRSCRVCGRRQWLIPYKLNEAGKSFPLTGPDFSPALRMGIVHHGCFS